MFTAANTELSVRAAELRGMTKVLGCMENTRPPAPGTSWERSVLCSAMEPVQHDCSGWDELHRSRGKALWQHLAQDPSVCPC